MLSSDTISSYLGPLVHNSDVLSKVAVLLAADWTRTPMLVVDIVDVPLQVCLEVAAVATLRTFKIFNLDKNIFFELSQIIICMLTHYLHVLLVDVVPEVGELPVAVWTGLGLAA